MANLRTTIVAAALALLAACAAKETAPAEAPQAPIAKAPDPVPAPKPAEASKPAEAPKAATPPPAPPAPAVEAPKKKTVQLGLPAIPTLKDDVGMNPKQLKSCREIYTSYKAKLDEAAGKVKAATDKKAANKEAAPLRAEVLAKLREVCSDDAQKAKFDQATARGKKKTS